MKAKKLVEVLDAYVAALQTAGSGSFASEIARLGEALTQKGGLEVAFILQVIDDGHHEMSDHIADNLRALANLQLKSGAKKFAVEIQGLSEAAQHRELARSINQIDLVRYFGRQLASTPETLKTVQPILKSMSATGVLNAKEAIAIAANFVGGPASYKNKKAALEAIRDRVARNEGLASKAGMS